jgi:hypothetical protein
LARGELLSKDSTAQLLTLLEAMPQLTLGNVGRAFRRMFAVLQASPTMHTTLAVSDGWMQLLPLARALTVVGDGCGSMCVRNLKPDHGPLATVLLFAMLLTLSERVVSLYGSASSSGTSSEGTSASELHSSTD